MNLNKIIKSIDYNNIGSVFTIVFPSIFIILFIVFSLPLILTNNIKYLHNLYNNNSVKYLFIGVPLVCLFYATLTVLIILGNSMIYKNSTHDTIDTQYIQDRSVYTEEEPRVVQSCAPCAPCAPRPTITPPEEEEISVAFIPRFAANMPPALPGMQGVKFT